MSCTKTAATSFAGKPKNQQESDSKIHSNSMGHSSAGALAVKPAEVASSDFRTSDCCARPSIANMDHDKYTADGLRGPMVRMVNRCCTRCWSHWYGPVNAVRAYTRREWDAYVGAVS